MQVSKNFLKTTNEKFKNLKFENDVGSVSCYGFRSSAYLVIFLRCQHLTIWLVDLINTRPLNSHLTQVLKRIVRAFSISQFQSNND